MGSILNTFVFYVVTIWQCCSTNDCSPWLPVCPSNCLANICFTIVLCGFGLASLCFMCSNIVLCGVDACPHQLALRPECFNCDSHSLSAALLIFKIGLACLGPTIVVSHYFINVSQGLTSIAPRPCHAANIMHTAPMVLFLLLPMSCIAS